MSTSTPTTPTTHVPTENDKRIAATLLDGVISSTFPEEKVAEIRARMIETGLLDAPEPETKPELARMSKCQRARVIGELKIFAFVLCETDEYSHAKKHMKDVLILAKDFFVYHVGSPNAITQAKLTAIHEKMQHALFSPEASQLKNAVKLVVRDFDPNDKLTGHGVSYLKGLLIKATATIAELDEIVSEFVWESGELLGEFAPLDKLVGKVIVPTLHGVSTINCMVDAGKDAADDWTNDHKQPLVDVKVVGDNESFGAPVSAVRVTLRAPE